eukprot:6731297-Ditylum_brightwellii.AAC.1
MPTYLCDSTTLKEKVINLTLPPECTLLTADATSMYTNIKTAPTLNKMLPPNKRHQYESNTSSTLCHSLIRNF